MLYQNIYTPSLSTTCLHASFNFIYPCHSIKKSFRTVYCPMILRCKTVQFHDTGSWLFTKKTGETFMPISVNFYLLLKS